MSHLPRLCSDPFLRLFWLLSYLQGLVFRLFEGPSTSVCPPFPSLFPPAFSLDNSIFGGQQTWHTPHVLSKGDSYESGDQSPWTAHYKVTWKSLPWSPSSSYPSKWADHIHSVNSQVFFSQTISFLSSRWAIHISILSQLISSSAQNFSSCIPANSTTVHFMSFTALHS